MKSLFEELGGIYTLGKDGMYYSNLMIDDSDYRPIGKWGRMQGVSGSVRTTDSYWYAL